MASSAILSAAMLLLALILCASAPHSSLGLSVRASPSKKPPPSPRPTPKSPPPKPKTNPPPSKPKSPPPSKPKSPPPSKPKSPPPSTPPPRSPSNRPSPRSPPTALPPPTKSPSFYPPPASPPPGSPPPASPPPGSPPPASPPTVSPPPVSPPPVSPPPSLPPPPPPPSTSPPPTSPPPATPDCQFTFRGDTFTSQRCVNVTTFLALYWTVNTADNTIDAFVRVEPGTSNGWVGFGLSPRCGMTDSRVIMAFVNGGDTSQAAVRPYLIKPSTPYLEPLSSLIPRGGVAALDVSNDGSSYAIRSGLQLSATGRQCVVYARGSVLTASQFSKSPVPDFQYHSFGRGVARINFATGSLG